MDLPDFSLDDGYGIKNLVLRNIILEFDILKKFHFDISKNNIKNWNFKLKFPNFNMKSLEKSSAKIKWIETCYSL